MAPVVEVSATAGDEDVTGKARMTLGVGRRRGSGEGQSVSLGEAVGVGHRLGPGCLERRGSSARYCNLLA